MQRPLDNYFSIKKLSLILGLTSVIGQVVILREMIVIFYGNETAYAVILASWLFWVSVGSFLISSIMKRVKRPLDWICYLQAAMFFILPLTIFSIRSAKYALHIPVGQMVSLLQMCTIAFLLLFPVSIMLGALYSLICLYSERQSDGESSSGKISTIYLWESAGSAAGGFIFSFILIHLLPSMAIVFLVGIINIFASYVIKEGRGFRMGPVRLAFFIVLIFAVWHLSDKLDKFSRKLQWNGLDIVKIEDSVYGNIALTKLGDEYSLYENGLLSFSTKDDLSSEQSVHFALLESPSPKNVLLIGNGIGGAIREILKYKGSTVDYVDLDPKVISISKEYLPKEDTKVLGDTSRVHVFIVDARYFVKTSKNKYDAIIINLSDPSTALINRYYSLEFFKEAKRILAPDGIISLSVTSSENFLDEETKSFLRSINTTLKQVFPSVISIPGDTNIFIACKEKGILTLDSGVIAQRLKERGIKTRFVREYYLPFKLSGDRIEYINKALSKKGKLNTDMRPVAYLYDILVWSGNFDNVFKRLIKAVEWIKLWHLLLIPLLLFIIGSFVIKKTSAFPVSLSIMTTGFSEIIFQIIVIIAFQSLYGFAYYRIGLIISSFMLGLVFGSLIARRMIVKGYKRIFLFYRFIQMCICVYPLLLPYLFVVFRDSMIFESHIGIFSTVFAVLPVIAGLMGGLQYPLAVELVRDAQKDHSGAARTAGFLYAFDVFGATVGALITATLFIPLLGIKSIAIFLSVLNGAVLLLLLLKDPSSKTS